MGLALGTIVGDGSATAVDAGSRNTFPQPIPESFRFGTAYYLFGAVAAARGNGDALKPLTAQLEIPGNNLNEALYALGEEGREGLRRAVGARCYASIVSLSRIENPRAFFRAIYELAKNLGRRDRNEGLAVSSYFKTEAILQASIVPSFISDWANDLMVTLQGQGGTWESVESNLSEFFEKATDPTILGPLLATGLLSQGVRLGALKVLDRYTRLRGFQAVAATAATTLAFEGPVYTALHQGALSIDGRPITQGFWEGTKSAWVNFAWFKAAGALGNRFVLRNSSVAAAPGSFWFGSRGLDWGTRWTAVAVPLFLQYHAMGFAYETEKLIGLQPGETHFLARLGSVAGIAEVEGPGFLARATALAQLHAGLSGARRMIHTVAPSVPGLKRLNLSGRMLVLENKLGFHGKTQPHHTFHFEVPRIDGIPETWSPTFGSGLRTERRVSNTRELANVIVEEGILPLFGRENVRYVFGYGSFPEFGGKATKAEPTSIRAFDADKVPDFIVVAENSKVATRHLANFWNLPEAEAAALVEHATYHPKGGKEGFTYYNTDMWIPGLGPQPFKVSLVDVALFRAKERTSRGQSAQWWAKTEYPGIRLKDARAENLLWVREGQGQGAASRAEALGHLESVRDSFLEMSYYGLGGGVFSLFSPGYHVRFSGKSPREWQWKRGFEFTGAELGQRFFTHSFRVEAYRFWEQGKPFSNKGRKLWRQRGEISRPILFPAFGRFAVRHADHLTLSLNGREISHREMTPENMYEVVFRDTGGLRGPLRRSSNYWREFPGFVRLNLRGLASYVGSGLPSSKSARAFYHKSHAEYAGRKARGILKMDDAQTKRDLGMGKRGFAWFLTAPEKTPGFWGRFWRPEKTLLWGAVPFLKTIQLDTPRSPIYYSTLPPKINALYEKGKIDEAGHRALMDWYASDPKLTTLRDLPLLRTLDPLLESGEASVRSAAQQLLGSFPSELVEKPVAQFIKSHASGGN